MIQLPTGQAPGYPAGVVYQYGWATTCPNPDPESPDHDQACTDSNSRCAANPPSSGKGPAVYVYRRVLSTPPTAWESLGWTCWPELVPGTSTPSMAMIEAAFHVTRFALPTVNIQPEGDRTLVTLPTYFEVQWPEQGFEPEEIDTVDPATMFGFDVRIRPMFVEARYDFGDGSAYGPTISLGGPYPGGDVVKTYDAAGRFDVQAEVVYRGEVSINGAEWIDVPGTATVPGAPVPLEVLTAGNHLYQPG